MPTPEENLIQEATSGQPAPDEAGPQPPEQAQEGPATQQPEQELILGKFRNYEELAKAYKELERKLGSRSQAAPTEPEEEEFGEPEPAELPLEEEQGIPETFWTRPAETVWEMIYPRVEASVLAALAGWTSWWRLTSKYPDAQRYERQMVELTPLIRSWLDKGVSIDEAVERAYQIARATSGQATSQQDLEAERARLRQQLLSTSVEAGGPQAPPATRRTSPEEAIAEAIIQAAGGSPVLRST